MTPAERIAFLIDRDIKEARALYRATYGSVDDRSVEEELHEALRRHDDGELVAVPMWIVLALLLRPRGPKGRSGNRPPAEMVVRRAREGAVRDASKLWRELIAAGTQSKKAKNDVAKEIASKRITARISVAWLLKRMRLSRD